MSIHIIVDGYNMIRQSSRFSDLDQQDIRLGRNALIDVLAVYRELKGHVITVVFDGIDMPSIYRQRDIKKGIEIKFSRGNETADQVISCMVSKEKHRALVVSCDREVISFAESCGASVIDSSAFEKKVLMVNYLLEDEFEPEKIQDKVKFITRKKGPSKRLPKGKRKHRSRINKL